ncbi:tyrosine-type recombinase/integrase [Chamaesiphon polymorphus]|uniref:Site-specific integrase n=1 Tax=Chamaesiphon polymorphus CCALA 037 TaxID=2107692 RepID=A0A2T1GJ04_9CYAN|nr:tyrosine-type recombinase/integrase [Chamaesiphon polymorphus]PSB57748.1 site-specific integrase [Chamaesiphon polymorphus CCALA 037]
MHIEEKGKSLIIRWRFEGKKFHKTLSKHNNPIGRKHAEMVMASIEKDIMCGRFDPSTYTQAGKAKKQEIATLAANDLFAKYAEHRMSDYDLSNSSRVRFKGIVSKLKQLLGKEFQASNLTPEVAGDAIALWSESVSNRTIRAYLFDLAAAWDWAVKEGLVECDTNPWSKSLDRLRKKLPTPKKPQPFSEDELRSIVGAFDRLPPSYSHYKDAAVFISQTACRFGEMAALTWSDVSENFDRVTISKSVSRGHLRDTTKTGESRTILLTPAVIQILKTRSKRFRPYLSDALVFPAPKGGFLNDNNFRNKIWKPLLKAAGVTYRKPYNFRHSGVSHAANNGVSIADLAAQTGHSTKTLMTSYLHPIEQKVVFTDYLSE